jgi:hypothetical protein
MQYLGQNQAPTVRRQKFVTAQVTHFVPSSASFHIELIRLFHATQLLTSAINVVIREVTDYGTRKLENVTPLVLVDHFVLRVFENVAEVPKQGPVLAKQEL